jgi:hypothetical protein
VKNFCGICGEFDLGCNQYGCWRSPPSTGASSMVLEAITKERAEKKPKYSLNFFGLVLLSMLMGVAVGWTAGK